MRRRWGCYDKMITNFREVIYLHQESVASAGIIGNANLYFILLLIVLPPLLVVHLASCSTFFFCSTLVIIIHTTITPHAVRIARHTSPSLWLCAFALM